MAGNDIRNDELISQFQHKRSFIQYGGSVPSALLKFAGQDAQYLAITGVSNPESGGIDPVFVPDPNRKKWRLAARSISAPDLPSADIVFREKHGAIPRALLTNGKISLFEATGACANLGDFAGGWRDYVMVYEDGEVTDKDLGDRTSFDSDDAMEDTLSMLFNAIYAVGSLGFGEVAAPEISREVVDVTYGKGKPCAPDDFGDKRIYALTTSSGAGSPGLPAEVIYSLDGGKTWTQTSVDNLGATESTYAIDIAGNYLVVVGNGAYYFTSLNPKTGAPSSGWTKVTTGFVATHYPKDIYVASPREVYFVGDLGYIYRCEDIPTGVYVLNAGYASSSNLLRVHGSGETIVITGAAGTVIRSANRGATWASLVSPEAGASIQAVSVLDNDLIWVGTSTGNVYYTENGGDSWTKISYAGLGAGAVYDIVFATRSVGYIAHSSATPTARLLCTWNGGQTWATGQYRVMNFPTFDKINRIAIPDTDDPGWRSNAVTLAGLGGDHTDGALFMGVAGKL